MTLPVYPPTSRVYLELESPILNDEYLAYSSVIISKVT